MEQDTEQVGWDDNNASVGGVFNLDFIFLDGDEEGTELFTRTTEQAE